MVARLQRVTLLSLVISSVKHVRILVIRSVCRRVCLLFRLEDLQQHMCSDSLKLNYSILLDPFSVFLAL